MSEADQSFNIAPPLDLGIPAHVQDFVAPILKGQEDLQTFFQNDLAIRIQSVKQNLTSQIRSVAKRFDAALQQINGSIKFLLKKEEDNENKIFPDIFTKIKKIDERITKIETDSSKFAANENADKNVSQKNVSVNTGIKRFDQRAKANDKTLPSKKVKSNFIYGTAPTDLPIPKNYIIAVSKIPNSTAFDEKWLEKEIENKLKLGNLDIQVTKAEKVPAKIAGAATKTIKIILTTTDTKIQVDQIYDPKIWPKGLKISRFRMARRRIHQHPPRLGKFRAVHDDVSAAQRDSS